MKIIGLLGVAFAALAFPAQAAVHKVKPGQSIQAAIDIALHRGIQYLVEPGEYKEFGNGAYGLTDFNGQSPAYRPRKKSRHKE